MADISSENILFTADPTPFEAGLSRMQADLAGFGRTAVAQEAPPSPSVTSHPGATAGMARRGVLAAGEDASKVTATFDAGMAQALKDAEEGEEHFIKQIGEAEAATGRLTEKWKLQAATVGMTSREADLYNQELLGASKEQLDAARAAGKEAQTAERRQQLKDAFSVTGKEGGPSAAAARYAGIAGGMLQAGLSRQPGQVEKPSDVLAPIGAVAAMLPGPLGSIASTITGAIGGVLDALTKESRIAAERAGNALASIATGARNAGQAIAGVRLDSMQEDLQAIVRDAAAGNLQREGLMGGNENLDAALTRRIAQMEGRANAAQQIAARIADNPAIGAQVARVAEMRVRQQGNEAVTSTREATTQDRTAAGLAAAGVDAGRTADALERQAMAQRLAREASISLEEAQTRLAGSMERFAQIQEQRRQAEASRQTGEAIRTGREELDVMQRRGEVVRNLDPFVADLTREEAELARLQRQGADAQLLQQRRRQVEDLRAGREQEMALQAGRQLTESTRNPLEEFDRERDRLEELRDRGAMSEDVAGRGMQAASNRLMNAAGEVPVGQAAAMEGSAAAASIIARANRQNERDDTPQRMLRAIEELRAVAQQQRQVQRENLELIRGGRIFQAVARP